MDQPPRGPARLQAGRDRAAYWTYRSIATFFQSLPAPVASGLATAGGLTMSELWRKKRPQVRANLRRVVGPTMSDAELEHLVVKAFDSYARYWVEGARLTTLRPKDVFDLFSIEGYERVEEEMAKHRGIILALPHLGCWDLGGLWLTLKGNPMTTVVEPLEPPALFEWFRAQREALGLTIHSFEPDTPAKLIATLRAGRLVGLVADRDLVGNGVEVEFFGEKTRLPAGAAVLALRTGAPLFPCAVYQRRGGRGHGLIHPPLVIERTGRLRTDVAAMTQMLAAEFEDLIRAAPEQWHMFQPNWPG
ncbi:MAG TPA: phosphatidylinositol mannoside acyltransferase, partial [Acidimicrobiales bacterium]|nr:phosphatidylinositol mannoside acyltransferase [Acidimicrobiales bacterium]